MTSDKDITGIMHQKGMVPVFYHDDVTISKQVIQACYNAGLQVFEFTNRGKNALEVFTHLTTYIRENLPGMVLGAGSVINGNSAEDFITHGADFIVSPLISDSVIEVCKKRNCLFIPGCGTVTEVGRAQKAGAEVVKLFPAEVLGPAFIKAIRGPMPWTNIMPTGGVTTDYDNLKAWFDAGAFCVGMGSALFSPSMIAAGQFDQLENKVRNVLQTIKEIRDV